MDTSYALTPSERAHPPATDLITVLVTLLVPPIGVLVRVGWHPHLLVSIVLTFLGWLPGVLHAVWVLGRYPRTQRSFR